MTVTLAARNATLADLASLLRDQQARKIDIVTPVTALSYRAGALQIDTDEVLLSDDGVTPIRGTYTPTLGCDADIANTFDIPVRYVRTLRAAGRLDLLDLNVNGLIRGRQIRKADGTTEVIHPADTRSVLVRAFRGDTDGTGVARAVLSNSYRIIDNLDALLAVLDGIRATGVSVNVDSCDLTETRMQVRISCPEVRALAPSLLAGYRSPFDGPNPVARAGRNIDQARALAAREGMGYAPDQEPIVFAGFIVTNSETGNGRFTITPRIVVQVCSDGLTVTHDALGAVHLGGRQDDGAIDWSTDTQEKAIALVTARARDAVTTFMSPAYLQTQVDKIEADAGRPVVKDPTAAVKVLTRAFKYDADTEAGILDHFIRGGQMTIAGLINATTSYAQVAADADQALTIEATALRIPALLPA